jgi:hypothetical protein
LDHLSRTLTALAMSASVAGCGGGALARAPQVRSAAAVTAPRRFFSPQSFWNRRLPADAALDSSSAASVAALTGEVEAEQVAKNGPWINTTAYSVPVYTVSAGQPTVRVELDGNRRSLGLARAWRAVPLPAGARPASGSDGDLVVWQPSSQRLWEFWRLRREGGSWRAAWGGAMRHTDAQSGVYGPRSWPGASRSWGISASSLSLAGGLVSVQQLRVGEIDHALEMAVPGPRAGVYAAPAQRSDGDSLDPLALPEGAHLRLDPRLDLDTLHLAPATLALARAAQRYGIIVTDRSPVVALYAEDPTPTGSNPYTAPGGLFEGRDPRGVLASFPWSSLQLLQMTLHRSR